MAFRRLVWKDARRFNGAVKPRVVIVVVQRERVNNSYELATQKAAEMAAARRENREFKLSMRVGAMRLICFGKRGTYFETLYNGNGL